MNLIKLAAVMMTAAVLAACGGGGGDPGKSGFDHATTTDTTTAPGGTGDVPGTTVPSAPTSIAFVARVPATGDLLIKGATATGRSDTATLKFKVVDQVGLAVKDVAVNFSASPAALVTLGILSAVTDADGMVSTSLTSKTSATTVVVTAVLTETPTIKTVSNSLNISGGDPVQPGFQVVAVKYNLDGKFIGSTTEVTAFAADVHGNPVPDGFSVNFTTNAGRVQGGCETVNGECSVVFTVQAPFGEHDDGLATITAIGESGSGPVTDEITIHMAGTNGSVYELTNEGSTAAVSATTLTSCKQDAIYFVNDGNGMALAAGSIVAVESAGNGAKAVIKLGGTVADALDGAFSPTMVIVSYDLSGITTGAANTCVDGGVGAANNVDIQFSLTTPNSVKVLQKVTLTYPH